MNSNKQISVNKIYKLCSTDGKLDADLVEKYLSHLCSKHVIKSFLGSEEPIEKIIDAILSPTEIVDGQKGVDKPLNLATQMMKILSGDESGEDHIDRRVFLGDFVKALAEHKICLPTETIETLFSILASESSSGVNGISIVDLKKVYRMY